MGKKLTQEEVKQAYAEKGYELISEYKNARDILFVKDNKGFIYSSIWSNFNKGIKPSKFHKSNPYSIQNIKLWMKTNAVGYELLSTEYINAHEDLELKCSQGHKFKMSWNNFHRGQRCPICSNHQVTIENCIITTDPWMVDLGMSIEDAKTHSKCSHDKIIVTCPHCGDKKEITILNMYKRKSISCSCENKTSYPEKFIICILNQLEIKYKKEYKPEWSNNKRYDFYLEDYNCIIECHGGQHYSNNNFSTCGGKTLNEEQQNDKYKKELALKNGVSEYIELDCRYSELEQIKNSILNSNLYNLLNLNNIDWIKCEKFASNYELIKNVCCYWKLHNEINNEGLTTEYISKIFNISRSFTINCLNKGSKYFGLCNYNGKEEMKKQGSINGKFTSKPIEIFKDDKSLGIFPNCTELSNKSENLFGIKLSTSCISSVCNGKQKQYKGFTFKYIEE